MDGVDTIIRIKKLVEDSCMIADTALMHVTDQINKLQIERMKDAIKEDGRVLIDKLVNILVNEVKGE